jgi:hypothetical protein
VWGSKVSHERVESSTKTKLWQAGC